MKNFLTLLIAMLSLLPMAMHGAGKKVVTSIDITIPLPKDGMGIEDGEQMQITAAKTAYGDLVQQGIASVFSILWEGEFNRKNSDSPKFQAGYTYRASMKLMLDTQSPYIIKYAMRDGDYYVDDTMLKITVNGEPARVLVGSPYFPRCSFVVTVPGGDGGNLKKENLFFDYNANKEKNRACNNVYTKETADACCASFHPHDVVTITETHDPLPEFEGPNRVFLTKVIVDTGNKTDYLKFAHSLTQYMGGYYNLKEVWLSDKVNAVEFMRELDEGMKSKLYPNYYHFYGHSTMFLAGDATLCVPASQAAAVKAQMARHSKFPCYTVRTYTGNVQEAQKAGLGATKNPCTKHNFVARLYTADLATEQAYVGTNAAGEHIYWKSCKWCGLSYNYEQRHLTEKHFRLSGSDGTLALYRKHMEAALDMREDEAKLSTTAQPDMFTLPARSAVKKSKWAEDEVTRALCDNLVDEQLLGNDYTLTATRQQVASIATRLIKEMTGKDANGVKLNLFADIVGGNLDMNAAVTRQEMATLIYRAMRYIEKNSEYTYTEYDSNLDAYTDSQQIKPWAKEPMAFMEALELVDPVTSTTLVPDGACSIELALATAERATMAQHTGWAQTVSDGEKSDYISVANSHDALGSSNSTLGFYERVWVYRMRNNNGKIEIKDKYTGQHLEFNRNYLHPVRWRGNGVSNVSQKVRNVRNKINKWQKKNDR